MKHAKLSVRWHGHALGAVVHGRDADQAVAAGIAEYVKLPRARRITTTPSPTRANDTEENHDHDPAPGDS